MRPALAWTVVGVFLALAGPRTASAFCRTMACPLPPNFGPTPDMCVPADFDSWCASQNPPAKPIPVWWRSACVSYDLQQNASKQVPYATADTMFAAAFAKWTSIDCPGPAASDGSSRVSIDVRDLGPVACDEVQYNQDQGNQHVIIFHDDVWPHDDQFNTLGLTTITYDPDTGEIYDADMEINATVPLSLTDPVPMDGYDFESIITHESGHFLGMAHSGDLHATMYAIYTPGATSMRVLAGDDVAGLCSIYQPDGERSVDPSVAADGLVLEGTCDPTPRHGFSTQCGTSPTKGCSVTASASGGTDVAAVLALVGAAGASSRRRRRPPASPVC
jgi:MYXO-CTERM domain-containing protein